MSIFKISHFIETVTGKHISMPYARSKKNFILEIFI